MCMNKTLFTMEKDKKGEFYGVGYKYIPREMISMGVKFKIGRWIEDKNKNEISGNPSYAAGFHILTSEKDAIGMFGGNSAIYKVYFKDIVAFGNENSSIGLVTCIIARKIKVIGKVSSE